MKKEIEYYLQNHDPLKKYEKKDSLMYCGSCESVWESFWVGRTFFKKYPDMPTYGLDRVECDECQSKEVLYG